MKEDNLGLKDIKGDNICASQGYPSMISFTYLVFFFINLTMITKNLLQLLQSILFYTDVHIREVLRSGLSIFVLDKQNIVPKISIVDK